MELPGNFPADLQDRLNGALPEGLKILQVKAVGRKVPSLQSSITTMVYRVNLNKNVVGPEMLQNISEQAAIFVSRLNKGKKQSLNIRPFIESVETLNGSLQLHLLSQQGKTVRVEDVLGYLFQSPREQLPFLPVHRQNQLVRLDGCYYTPMEII
jgi:radical SAM-linked protein